MKKLGLALTVLLFSVSMFAQTTIKIFDEILFYDGYAETVKEKVPKGVVRHKNSLYATKLSKEQLSQFGDSIKMTVVIKAACDNYDRLAHVNLAFVPKKSKKYDLDKVERIEIARYVTPFMYKHTQPDTVHYEFEVSYLNSIFKNSNILNNNDIWVELEVFGVPYAAQKEVKGCDGRIDVFYGSLFFTTSSSPSAVVDKDIVVPLLFHHQLKNYDEDCTDVLGETVKIADFTVDNDLKNVKMILITSNHGANKGGEEYVRRMHYVYFNGDSVLTYIPGRNSCERFRYRNTQPNGIYGREPRTDEEWQEFSNWCPGDVIDTRIVDLGNLSKGKQTFKIEVPEAEFNEQQGYFPLSVYFIGTLDD